MTTGFDDISLDGAQNGNSLVAKRSFSFRDDFGLRHFNVTPYCIVRILLGGVLLVAAGLKGHQLATEPVIQRGLFGSPLVLLGLVEFEFVFGFWLCAGLHPRATWWMALFCFGISAEQSLYKVVTGDDQCGCFGRLSVNPGFTLAFDVTVIGALFWVKPISARPQADRYSRRLTMFMGLPVFSMLASAYPTAQGETWAMAKISVIGSPIGGSYLRPESWVGKALPMLEYIDIGDELRRGRWVVVLVRPDCRKCRAMLPRLEEDARRLQRRDSYSAGFALVEFPPLVAVDRFELGNHSPFVHARLAPSPRWRVETPAIIRISDGTVLSSCTGDGCNL